MKHKHYKCQLSLLQLDKDAHSALFWGGCLLYCVFTYLPQYTVYVAICAAYMAIYTCDFMPVLQERKERTARVRAYRSPWSGQNYCTVTKNRTPGSCAVRVTIFSMVQ